MNRENTERYAAIMDAPEKTVTQLKDENERLTQALYDASKFSSQLGCDLFNLISEPLGSWLNEMAPDFLETHFDVANYIDDIADTLPDREINFYDHENDLRDIMQDILKHADIKITV